MSKPLLVVLGMFGQIPLAGMVWQVLHYLEGFRRLGFDAYYVEDNRAWPYDPEQNTITDDCTYTVNYIGRIMGDYGFSERWAYRAAAQGDRIFGLTESEFLGLFRRADILVNITGATELRSEHLQVPIRIYLETDPVLPQIEIAKGNQFYIDLLNAHTHYLTFGENIGRAGCRIPVERFKYLPTRQPVVMEWWNPADRSTAVMGLQSPCFTTIASWRQTGKDLEWKDETYTWSKHHEFLKFIDLPQRTTQPLELALAIRGNLQKEPNSWLPLYKEDADAIELLTSHQWRVVNALRLSREISSYRDYILHSRGEFTVAKDQNVRLRTGWFSDRSACYLAAGRPVVTQDTGFGSVLPTGVGLFSYDTMEEILAALESINSDYDKHSRAARAIADEYFRAETVSAGIIRQLGL
jgi:hypothetical protein